MLFYESRELINIIATPSGFSNVPLTKCKGLLQSQHVT